jgi:hypothetical protein
MSQVEELVDLVNKLPKSEIKTAKSFLQFLIEKPKHEVSIVDITLKTKSRISLQGIISGSKVTEEDFNEAKQIWQ